MTRKVPHRQDSRRTARPAQFDPSGSDGGPAAACLDRYDVFYHPDDERGPVRRRRINRAKTICGGCPLLAACRDEALSNREQWGIWGGLTPEERNEILMAREARTRGLPDRIVREMAGV